MPTDASWTERGGCGKDFEFDGEMKMVIAFE